MSHPINHRQSGSDLPALVADLHAAYTAATGNELRMNYLYQQAWTEFLQAGWSIDDLRLVLTYTRRKIQAGEGGFNAQSLMLRILCADGWLKFDERLNLARSEARRTQTRPRSVEAAQTNATGTRLVETKVETAPEPASDLVKQTMADFRKQMGRPPKPEAKPI